MPVSREDRLPSPPARPADAHKGTFGRVLIVAGSRGMSGAAALAGLGALRGGAGLVYVAIPQGIASIVAAVEPSYLTIPLPEDSATGRLCAESRGAIDQALAGKDALAIGPGWGRSPALRELAGHLYRTAEVPAVVDADALNNLADDPDVWSSAARPRILTPHPGEFARMTDRPIAEIQSQREEAARRFAAEHGIVVVLKGRGTVVTDGNRIAVNTTGNSGMATGGTGDVLTGLMAALLAQGMTAFDAARLAVHLHGSAGDLAAADLSQPALIASDVARYLSHAWRQLLD